MCCLYGARLLFNGLAQPTRFEIQGSVRSEDDLSAVLDEEDELETLLASSNVRQAEAGAVKGRQKKGKKKRAKKQPAEPAGAALTTPELPGPLNCPIAHALACNVFCSPGIIVSCDPAVRSSTAMHTLSSPTQSTSMRAMYIPAACRRLPMLW